MARKNDYIFKLTFPDSREYKGRLPKLVHIKAAYTPKQAATAVLKDHNLLFVRNLPEFRRIKWENVTSDIITQLTDYFSSPDYKEQEQTMGRYLEEVENLVKMSGSQIMAIYKKYESELRKRAPI